MFAILAYFRNTSHRRIPFRFKLADPLILFGVLSLELLYEGEGICTHWAAFILPALIDIRTSHVASTWPCMALQPFYDLFKRFHDLCSTLFHRSCRILQQGLLSFRRF